MSGTYLEKDPVTVLVPVLPFFLWLYFFLLESCLDNLFIKGGISISDNLD